MGKMKELCLQHKGYFIEGSAEVEYWSGSIGPVGMKPFFIPADKLTPGRIKDGINDGGFGTKSIISARVIIYDSYGERGYLQHNRDLDLNTMQCFKGKRGI